MVIGEDERGSEEGCGYMSEMNGGDWTRTDGPTPAAPGLGLGDGM